MSSQRTWDEIEKRLNARREPALHVDQAPSGYRLKGVSTLVNKAGDVIQQWVKTTSELDPMLMLDIFRAAVADSGVAARHVDGVVQREAEGEFLANRMAIYPIGDAHFGMLSWAAETGEDFDLQIAERHLTQAMSHLVDIAPPAQRALIVNVGDFLHADGYVSRTPTSGHALDTDTRWPKVLRVAIRVLVRAVDLALAKHEHVDLINQPGNHDPQSAIMLALCLEAYYRNEPRVTIDTTPAPRRYREFGTNLIGVTHGHTTKAKDLGLLMAAEVPEMWGRAKHRSWICGHIHHEVKKEFVGVTVETFNTLAAKDAWHNEQGYNSRRQMSLIVLDKTYGEIVRHRVGVEQLDKERV
jgi:hypothetical protein